MEEKNVQGIIRQNPGPGFERTLSSLNNIMVAVCRFSNGPAERPDDPHSHPHEQITYVAEGEVMFYLGEKELKLKKGDLIAIPANVRHCIRTLTRTVVLVDSFSPVRTDFF